MANNKIKPSLIIVLTTIMIISAMVLTFIYQTTTPLIEEHAAKAKENAILGVLPGAVEYKKIEKNGLKLYKGLDESGNQVGVAMVNEGQGFQDAIELMIGIDVEEKKLLKIKVLQQLDTPGLGARISEEQFKSQFKGKSFSDSYVAKKDVDAIAGATISSQAVADILKDSINKVQKAYGGGE